jgi:dCTP deaminase
MAVLSDRDIEAYCTPREPLSEAQRKVLGSFAPPEIPPLIEPFTLEQLKPASYDVRLGTKFVRFEPKSDPAYVTPHVPDAYLRTVEEEVKEGGRFLLWPNEFALAETVEWVNVPDNLVGRVEGKSTLGRQGIMVHVTAGYLDSGFRGKVTLEIKCLQPWPLILYPGICIAQFSFDTLTSPCRQPYTGRYQNAEGVQPAREEKS